MLGSLTGLFGLTCLPGLTQIELSGSGRGPSPAVVLGPFAHVAARQLSANSRPRRNDRIGSGKTLSVFPASPLQSGPAAFGQFQPTPKRPLTSNLLPKPEQQQSTQPSHSEAPATTTGFGRDPPVRSGGPTAPERTLEAVQAEASGCAPTTGSRLRKSFAGATRQRLSSRPIVGPDRAALDPVGTGRLDAPRRGRPPPRRKAFYARRPIMSVTGCPAEVSMAVNLRERSSASIAAHDHRWPPLRASRRAASAAPTGSGGGA